MKKLMLLVALSLVGCGPDNGASIPADYSSSQQPATPPAITSGGDQPQAPPPPSLNP